MFERVRNALAEAARTAEAAKAWIEVQEVGYANYKEYTNYKEENMNPTIRSSTLHKFLATPFQSILEGACMLETSPTPQMLTGTALHALFFETGQKIEPVPKTTKKIFEEEGTIFIKDEYYQELLKINTTLKTALNNKDFEGSNKDLPLDGIVEQTIIIDRKNHILQGTPDLVNDDIILDYKTTSTFSSATGWYWRARKVGYLCQLQHYDNLCNIKYGEKNRRWIHLVQSIKEPYEIMLVEFDPEIKVELKQWYDSTLERYLVEFDACKNRGFKQSLELSMIGKEDVANDTFSEELNIAF